MIGIQRISEWLCFRAVSDAISWAMFACFAYLIFVDATGLFTWVDSISGASGPFVLRSAYCVEVTGVVGLNGGLQDLAIVPSNLPQWARTALIPCATGELGMLQKVAYGASLARHMSLLTVDRDIAMATLAGPGLIAVGVLCGAIVWHRLGAVFIFSGVCALTYVFMCVEGGVMPNLILSMMGSITLLYTAFNLRRPYPWYTVPVEAPEKRARSADGTKAAAHSSKMPKALRNRKLKNESTKTDDKR
ncbi:hypothetical protein SARC_05619 [Sphaeroforma arctica JP610]|uniref:Uncharacterized protein n=1 Tax=Sphaeroforma arctica JP610 TaxID=667725 RepID=A0A0L0FZ54_9EUKA|nr:hypothetical protein SARC_05619 [Sphaeroforma arctica JP610]KNC82090.1 hypothetical protein SARC_05619 [Sphaeroforma arctica JP610]|eukprot:XP_014155992.1 hypothetical protein SARC_05619 [Sphaeroforma arctica JP610]